MARKTPSADQPFISLRSKFVVFVSMTIIAVCSGLSSYVIRQQADLLTASLLKTGALITGNLSAPARESLLANSPAALERLLDEALNLEEVIYVAISTPEGHILTHRIKPEAEGRLNRQGGGEGLGLSEIPETASRLNQPVEGPVITRFSPDTGERQLLSHRGASGWDIIRGPTSGEFVYDFSFPIFPSSESSFADHPLNSMVEEPSSMKQDQLHPYPLGVIQVGLTNAQLQGTLNGLVGNILVMTLMSILVGIGFTALMAKRVITPLKNLAGMAQRVAKGDFAVPAVSTAHDEVGQLSRVFMDMQEALRDREQAIERQLTTITTHVTRLTTLHETTTAITSHLDLPKLLNTVLHLLVEKLGFSQVLLMQYDPHRGMVFGLQTAGHTETSDLGEPNVELPVSPEASFFLELLAHDQPLLLPDIEHMADGIPDPILAKMRQLGIRSCVCAPLKSQQQCVGFIVADGASGFGKEDDGHLLMTIANTIGVAIDNALAYQQLERLTVSLEERVDERTAELQRANAELEELSRLKSGFVSVVSHELRTPMTSIKGLVENMLDGVTGALTERQEFYLSRVKVNIERLTRMIHDLLDLSQIEAGRMELHTGLFSVSEVAMEATETLNTLASRKSVTLSLEVSDTLPMIMGDRDKILQVFTNLLHNAIKFSPEGGTVRVFVTRGEREMIQVCVADTGCGIPPEERDSIFERFYRGQAGPSKVQGAGLGLAITKNLVELHGGTMWVESQLGQGSRFFFTLPTQHPLPPFSPQSAMLTMVTH